MDERADSSRDDERPPEQVQALSYARRYQRYAGLVAVVFLLVLLVVTLLNSSNRAAGIPTGQRVPSFAVPLASSRLEGDANVATRADEGEAGRRPACSVRGPDVLNVCQLYESRPLVLALFVNGGSCPAVVGKLNGLARSFPGVNFAAVAIRGDRGALRSLIAREGWTIPVGYDRDGALAPLYRLATCPQVSFISRGGAVQSASLLGSPSTAELRARVGALAAARPGASGTGVHPSM
jgi:hypothetical protein